MIREKKIPDKCCKVGFKCMEERKLKFVVFCFQTNKLMFLWQQDAKEFDRMFSVMRQINSEILPDSGDFAVSLPILHNFLLNKKIYVQFSSPYKLTLFL